MNLSWRNVLRTAPVVACITAGATFLITSPAHASGQSSAINGCYSKWWNTASASYCEPATVTGAYQNQYKCSTDYWYAGNDERVNAGQWLQGFSHGECTFSVKQAYTPMIGS